MENITQFIDSILNGFAQKQRKILVERYGLKNGKPKTLQKIGEEFKITRERVRQIVEQGMKELRSEVKEKAVGFLDSAKNHLVKSGGVRRDDNYITDLKFFIKNHGEEKYVPEKIRFLLWSSSLVSYAKEDENMRSFWYADETSKKKFLSFVDELTAFFKSQDRQKLLNEKTYLGRIKDMPECHFISIPKYFGMNVFGDVGLTEWPEIEPKTIRDKIYLALKKHNAPLHFEDIAKSISNFGIDQKSAHVQTVHNELIKDNRFVLVGRGIYALREYGFEPGTVKEVIAKLLKDKGPLTQREVITLVNERRFFKENTILLNLQNRRHFKRLDDGRYHVKEV